MKTKLALSVLLLTLFFSFEKGMGRAPSWAWAHNAFGGSDDHARSIAVDSSGNSFITGNFGSPTIIFGSTTLTNATSFPSIPDFFIAKYDPSGNVLWAKRAGGSSYDCGLSVVTDPTGNAYVTGFFASSTITFDTTTLIKAGNQEIFVVKYDPSGNVLWAKGIGGTGFDQDQANSICIDANGNLYLTGYFNSTLIFGNDTLVDAPPYGRDIFVLKYDSSGNELWAKCAGGSNFNSGTSNTVDGSGNLYVAGTFNSDTFFIDNHFLINAKPGFNDIFIIKYDSLGNLLWANSASGDSSDYPGGLATDLNGNLFMSGSFRSPSISFGNNILTNAIPGNDRFFLVKYDSSGSVTRVDSVIGGGVSAGTGIVIDKVGNLYLIGYFGGSALNFGNSVSLTSSGGVDIMILKYNVAGNVLWGQTAGSINNTDYGLDIALDFNNNIYTTGWFYGTPIVFGNIIISNSNSGSVSDIFIAKLDNPTGIAEQTPTNNLTLYPNPATDYLTINTTINKKQVITISDITGKIIYSTTTLSDKTIINTKDFPQGVYAVQVQAGDAVQTRKVVVTR